MNETLARWRDRCGGATALAAVIVVIIGSRLMLHRVEVRGRSMTPALRPGDRLLLRRRLTRPRAGQLVALEDPRGGDELLIKRVARVRADGVTVLGDNLTSSTDSRTFGPVEQRSIRWIVVRRYRVGVSTTV